MPAQFCALFFWTPVSTRILALVPQLYERNKLKTETDVSFTTIWHFASDDGD